jgi:predicted ester cyclase
MDNNWVQKLFSLWHQADQTTDLEAAFAAFYTDPVLVNGVEMSTSDLVARARSLNAGFADLTADILQVVDDGDSLGVASVMRGRHTGPYAGPLGIVQPTGIDVEIRTIDILRLTEGKVSTIWVIADDLGLLRQLGAVSESATESA